MKTLIAATLAATTLVAGAASANVSSEVQYILPEANYQGLTMSQEAQIDAVVYTDKSRNEKRAIIRSILSQS